MSEMNGSTQTQRNRRSGRYTVPVQQDKKPNTRKKRAAKKAAGKFPVRTVIVLALAFVLAVVMLLVANGNMKRLYESRQQAQEEYQRLVDRHTVRYRNYIEKYAAENDVHPAFIAAIILRESSYDPLAESNVGARGLMQVMKDTYDFVSGKLNDGATWDDMYDAETNIRYGCWYIGYLSRIFNGDPIRIACAYHAGPNNVKLWAMKYAPDGVNLRLEDIPMDDTQYYAGKVMNAYAIYFQHHYPDQV
ncbi:MAG: lytic transglycosylase domain-containing protein [Clostridia bacterium]|nr:lytic transglycosylase domain-containing protein [Clostridia bacterium]